MAMPVSHLTKRNHRKQANIGKDSDVDPIKRIVALTAKVQWEHSDFFFNCCE